MMTSVDIIAQLTIKGFAALLVLFCLAGLITIVTLNFLNAVLIILGIIICFAVGCAVDIVMNDGEKVDKIL